MANYHGLLQTIKQAATEAVDAGNPVCVSFGKVLSITPLKVLVDQKITLGEGQLVLSGSVCDAVATTSIGWESESADGHRHTIKGKKQMTVYKGLKQGEKVILLRMQGGQKYIVLDRVGGVQ